MDDNIQKDFFYDSEVESSCYKPIKTIFETLLLQKKIKQQDLADSLGIDKAYISRVVNGLYIPDIDMRLKIAAYFGVDSALIWRTCDLYHIRKLLLNQKKVKNGKS